MSVEHWQEVGVVSGALLALLSLIGLIYRKVVRPVWRAAWRTIRRLNQVADDLLGDPVKKVPSMTERMAAMESKLDDHLRWHGSPGGKPAGPNVPPSNSERPRRAPPAGR